MLKNNHGYTLTELIVVMAIFVTVMVVTTQGFLTVITQVGQQSKLMETDIGSVVGLELFRSDLQNAGYGLPWAFQNTPAAANYVEVATTDDDEMPYSATFWPTGQSPRNYNDASTGVPRAVQSGNTTFNLQGGIGSRYLVLKSLTIAPGATQKKWVTVVYSDTAKSVSSWNNSERDFITTSGATEKLVVLRNVFSSGVPSRTLQVTASGNYATTFSNLTTQTLPHSAGDVFQVYGVDPATEPRAPFNRADYYVDRPANPPPACAPNTGVLYKAVLNHSAGFTVTPLLDCVADMQVVYGLGPVGSTQVNLHQITLPEKPGAPGENNAKEIREQVKEIRVYLLAQIGRKDTGYKHPDSTMAVGESFDGGATLLGRNFDLTQIGSDWANYRWKVYSIVVRPQNLIQ